ncbi:MAG: hypothetical protein ACREQV_24595 [Candidatus Binatia bacterium]
MVVAVIVAGSSFALSMWLRNLSLIVSTFRSPIFSAIDSLTLMIRLLGGIVTDATTVSAILVIAASLLFGINLGLFAFYVERKRSLPHVAEGTSTLGGLIAAIFGVGCASCGTFVLGAVLSSAGAGSLLALLPLGGHEFLIISVGLLVASIYALTRSIESSNVCAVP